MKAEYITESGMKFGPYPEGSVLRIEKAPQYIEIQQGMRIAEFIYYDKARSNLVSLEAKTTAPNPNSDKVPDPREVFQKYITEIREKFENALDLYANLALKKALPEGFKQIDYKKTEVVFILVIRNHEREWLKDVKDALEMAVRSIHRTNKIWKCKVLVLNRDLAIKKHLVEGGGTPNL